MTMITTGTVVAGDKHNTLAAGGAAAMAVALLAEFLTSTTMVPACPLNMTQVIQAEPRER